MKLNFEEYITLLDRMLERKGLSTSERDIILKSPENNEMIVTSFNSKTHPTTVLSMLDMEPISSMYEGKRKPYTKEGKEKKFKKVMGEFGKGKLKPYHGDSALKSKKQGGSAKERKQALAIAFSEAGLTEGTRAKFVNWCLN